MKLLFFFLYKPIVLLWTGPLTDPESFFFVGQC